MSDDGETIEPEFEETNETFEKRFDDKKLQIKIKANHIIFILIKGPSHYEFNKRI